jgi:uncharacterized membrane protein HdeD (DUF308 family)
MPKRLTPFTENRILVIIVSLAGLIALSFIFRYDNETPGDLGGLIFFVSLVELFHGFRRAKPDQRAMAWKSGGVSLLMGIFLINASLFRSRALTLLVGATFIFDVVNYSMHALKETDPVKKKKAWFAAAGNLAVLFFMLIMHEQGVHIALAIAIALRIFGTAYNMHTAEIGNLGDVSEDLMLSMKLSDNAEISELAES